ncbi:hypothetical protein L6E12_22720 [Actinokineospora sp. PR83]|uniref:DUF6973 domain-containing protein n=1 Tax=Actinokineospora sp. PR83 TaxID=2884908 RepID=UPI001F45665A|nr:hypothetical protein [Actinokineospora sp. PR83]MCG8918600.1 hypothetical protein [Actinokineospora sp. PR83]
MVDFGDVRQWRAGPLDVAVGVLNSDGQVLVGTGDELAAAGVPDGWQGEAAQAAHTERDRLADRMEHIVAGIAAARRAVGDAADSVVVIERLVREVDEVAGAHGFVVDDGGQVVRAAGVGAGGADEEAVAADLRERVRVVTRLADEVDGFLSGVLDKVAADGVTDGGAVSLADAASAGERQGGFHDELLRKYNVTVDPGGVVMYPDGMLGWALEQMGIKPQKMTAGEAAMLDDIGLAGTKDAYDIYRTAIHDAENVFGGAGITDGHSDAFRHAYWNAMLANRFGPEWAAQYTTAHERVDTNSATAEAMDLHNNEVGRRIAAEHPDAGPEELKEHIDKAVRDGEMVVVGSDGRLVPSNEVPIGETGRAQDDPATGGNDPKAQGEYEDDTSGGYNPGGDGDSYGTYDN